MKNLKRCSISEINKILNYISGRSLIGVCALCLCFFLSNMASSQTLYKIENSSIDESSGLAMSTRYDNVIWTHNDSGSMAIIYAMNTEGKDLGTFFLGGESPADWEDISAFQLNGQSYLLLADTGDNKEIRMGGRLTIYPEPDIYHYAGEVIEPAWEIEFTYPDFKSYDVEAVAVDIQNKKILMLSKRNKKARLFELPLQSDDGSVEARLLRKFKYIKRPVAMDISRDGKEAVILVFGKVFWYQKEPNQSWKKKFKTPDKSIKFNGLRQPEGICLDSGLKAIYISSERLPAKLLKITKNY